MLKELVCVVSMSCMAVVIVCSFSTPAVAVTHVSGMTIHGDDEFEFFGFSASGAGDVNGDGFDDIVVGAIYDNYLTGSARVFSGDDGTELYAFYGNSAGNQFGFSVSGAGDVNDDGYDDIIAGAWHDDNNGVRSGSARVHSGVNGAMLFEYSGHNAEDVFGGSVSGAGDVNGDGHADLIVGARGGSGSARVISGKNGNVLYELTGDNAHGFGHAVSGAGDVNNDGYDDLIVGALSDDNNGIQSGSARVVSGIDGAELFTFSGGSAGDIFGSDVSGAGDVNSDGFDDLIVGAPGNYVNSSGSARVMSGIDGLELYTFIGDNTDDKFGYSVSGAGDINGDGYDDLIVGAPLDDNAGNNSGSARILSGIDGSVLLTFNGDHADDLFGRSVSGAGDVNGDGIADFIVGAVKGGLNNGGYVRVFVSVPEPSTLLLLAAGGAACVRRRAR